MEHLEDSPGKPEGKPSQDAAQRLLGCPGGDPGAHGRCKGWGGEMNIGEDGWPRPDPSWLHTAGLAVHR